MVDESKLPELLTLEEAAELMRVTVRTVRRRIEEGELSAYKFGGKVLLKREDLLAMLKPWHGEQQ